jgi:uncharacterized membrane protein
MMPTPDHSLHTRSALLAGLALAGFAIASYLALYQLQVLATVWEPLFGNGSELILHSSLARSLPIPDAALGAVGYLIEVLCVAVRARSPGWVSAVYKSVVTIFALASVVLIALQWSYFHAWCTLCLLSAALSFVIAGIVMSESSRSKVQ